MVLEWNELVPCIVLSTVVLYYSTVSAFKPFCPAHIVLRNIYIVLCIVSNK